jgi:NAD(P)-dependent dehydrogenase (short-subunit alcohol dehydrogenase family)
VSEVLLVTGSSGIAAATARFWGAQGSVFIVGVKEEECRSLAAELPRAGFNAADVRDEEGVRKSVAACLERFGKIDALFNVAGISARSLGDGPLHECSTEAWDTVMDVNAKGTFLMCREVLRNWTRHSQKGVILNCGSVLAQRPQREHFRHRGLCRKQGSHRGDDAFRRRLLCARRHPDQRYRTRTGSDANERARAERCPRLGIRGPQAAFDAGSDRARGHRKDRVLSSEKDSSPITGQVITADGGWAVSA